jgi:hypothetical protein
VTQCVARILPFSAVAGEDAAAYWELASPASYQLAATGAFSRPPFGGSR